MPSSTIPFEALSGPTLGPFAFEPASTALTEPVAGHAADIADPQTASQTAKPAQPITQATDPRWVLASRVGQMLDGTALPMEKRDRLVALGNMLGLTAFDANLIIAIVQDQARRGHFGQDAAQSATGQLAMIALPHTTGNSPSTSPHIARPAQPLRWVNTLGLLACMVAVESYIVWYYCFA